MSTQNRTGGGGSRNQSKKSNSSGGEIGSKKTDVKAADKEKSQPKPTAEQIRIAQITDCRSEDPKMREKVATLIEMTQRSEEEVCCALYECDNNLEKAVVFLLETLPVGAFETSSKKKKNRTTNATTDGTADGEWSETNNNTNNNNADNNNRDRSRNRATIRSGRGGSDSRGWRGREARENERNASDSKGGDGGWRGGRGRGGSRGGYGGRGGRGGRAGPRGMGSRDSGRNYSRQNQDTQEVDTWDNAIATNAEQMKQQDAFSDAWGDWDNEEYVGSLKDTKVFTPSNLQTQNMSVTSDLSAPPGLEQHMVNASHMTADDLVQQYSTSYSTTVVSSTTTAPAAVNSVQFADIHSAAANAASQHLRLGLDTQQINASSTLSAEQSQYFNSLPSQGSNQQTNVNSYQNTSVQYATSYVSNNVFGDQNVTSQPSVRRARAKVPPPSKIPASAVEMPGDTLNNIGYLDVQFGGLDFAAEESFDTLTEKFNATTIDGQQNVQSQEVSGDYQSKSSSQQSSLPSALQTSQMIPNSDTLSSSQTDPLSSSYSQRATGNVSQQNTGVGSSINASGNNALDQLSKSDPYNQTNASSTTGYQNSYNSTSTTNKSASYQSSGSTQGYNSSNYSTNSQVKVTSGGNSFQPSSNSAYNTYNQNSVSSYQQQNNTSANSSSSSAAVNASSATNSGSATQNIPVGGSNSAVNNAGSNTNAAGYLSNQYQSNQTSSAFPSQQSTGYQNSQNVYGTTGLTNNTGFSGSTNTSSSQYSNFNSSKLKETSASASTHFESVSNVTSSSATSSTVSSVSSSSVTTNSMSSPSLGLANTKVTNSTAKSTAGGILPNIQMVSQYIQTGLPYYQQPLYSYEDIQMMQQRMPHVTQYYDINYPPTSLGAAGVRDANLGSVAYSTMTDGRFTRTDNNSSPVSNVSSTMSQQAGSGGPMLNVPYAYFYGGNMMPGGFQYGTPAIYPQQMPTANATSGGQFPKPSYNSGYGSTSYDALSQATQDYSKGAYAGSGVSQQSKAQAVTNQPQAASASDITSSMYGKSHVALNKVNSYEKQSFHSGTPPPFNLTGTQTAAGTSAQPYGMYIQPMPAAHHNMNIHQPIHQMDGRIQNTTRRDSSSTGQRQQQSSQSKSGSKQGYSPSYWTAQN